MADNVLYTQGAGTNIATDDVGGVHFQKFKLDVGPDGATLQPAGSIPVYIVSGTGAYLMNDPFVDAVAIAGQLDDTGTTAATENNVAPARITAQRALHINLRNVAGLELSTPTNPVIISGSATLMGYDDLSNSTSVPLGSNAVFSGAAFDTLNYPAFSAIIKSDVASASGGLSFQWSMNGLDWDVVAASDVAAATGRAFMLSHRGRYFRVVYTNGGVAQIYFRLDIIHRPSTVGIITRPLDDAINTENFAQTTRAVINAQKPDATFTNLQANADGLLRVLVSGTVDPQLHNISTVTSVAFSSTNVTLLSANTIRRMATFYNDVNTAAYVKLGATATVSSFTVKMTPQSYYELPSPYTGIIDALWDAGGIGSMRITEIT